MTKPKFAAVCSLTTAPVAPPSSLFVRKLSHPLQAFLPVSYIECQAIPFSEMYLGLHHFQDKGEMNPAVVSISVLWLL